MRRSLSLPPVLAVLVLMVAGCGGSKESGSAPQEGTGGSAMSETDVEVVADAVRTIRSVCTVGGDAAALVGPARLIATQTLRSPTQVFESGDSDRALEMHDLANQMSQDLTACKAPAAAAILKSAYAKT